MATHKKTKKMVPIKLRKAPVLLESQFAEVAELIQGGRRKALASVNSALIDTYWRVGQYIGMKVEKAEWGSGVVKKLADYLQHELPDPRGFSDKNLWRMKQFHDLYGNYKKLSTVLRELSWSSHLHIMSKTRTPQEREFYLQTAIKERYSVRELERAIACGLFERSVAASPKLSAVLRVSHPKSKSIMRDSYSLDFLGLPDGHSEADLRKAIVRSLKNFIIEFGRDFAFIGEEYRVQVGMKDFFLDLLFYHRELRCLVAFELKIDEFKPEYLGKLSFYLEALDRDVKKSHENPSIGIVLCKGKDDEIVEYALSRTLSPAAIADYTTKLPDKRLLQDKLHEFFDSSVREMRPEYEGK
jgi:predicted nuclease of restriction endonuclease-like (RecB) superfamily